MVMSPTSHINTLPYRKKTGKIKIRMPKINANVKRINTCFRLMVLENYKIIHTHILINSKSNASNTLYMCYLCFIERNIFLRTKCAF